MFFASSISLVVGGGSMAGVVALPEALEGAKRVFFTRERKKESGSSCLVPTVASRGGLGLTGSCPGPMGEFVQTSGTLVWIDWRNVK